MKCSLHKTFDYDLEMSKATIEESTERFHNSIVEMRSRIELYLTKIEADDWTDELELLATIAELGKAGARIYNATKPLAGDSPFSLDTVVKQLRRGKIRE